MAQCYGCGRKFGLFESKVRFRCKYCGRHGCKSCGKYWLTFKYFKAYEGTNAVYGNDRFCSNDCIVAFLSVSPGMMNSYGESSYPYADQSYQGALYRFFNHTYNIGLL
ncbi:MAG: hypothetical protein KAW09_04750, partial [Thermoplasmata archaeon]|nr:hypothetical protein [Thermoplasmata archaeon]